MACPLDFFWFVNRKHRLETHGKHLEESVDFPSCEVEGRLAMFFGRLRKSSYRDIRRPGLGIGTPPVHVVLFLGRFVLFSTQMTVDSLNWTYLAWFWPDFGEFLNPSQFLFKKLRLAFGGSSLCNHRQGSVDMWVRSRRITFHRRYVMTSMYIVYKYFLVSYISCIICELFRTNFVSHTFLCQKPPDGERDQRQQRTCCLDRSSKNIQLGAQFFPCSLVFSCCKKSKRKLLWRKSMVNPCRFCVTDLFFPLGKGCWNIHEHPDGSWGCSACHVTNCSLGTVTYDLFTRVRPCRLVTKDNHEASWRKSLDAKRCGSYFRDFCGRKRSFPKRNIFSPTCSRH